MLCLFSSTLEFNNLFCSYKGEGTGAVRHMFSHHILKPERAPLENSVWGTDKSSGTFSTLFESRLLRAKRYLREPFELKLGRDLLGGTTKPHKVVSSGPLAPKCVETWHELQSAPQAVMVLNGDSARLPLPDMSVDAIVTDPPYFDFIHYSELSDFFFAWLAGPLAGRYPWMKRTDSSAKGEVQARDPRVFAQRLGRGFCRVPPRDEAERHPGVQFSSFTAGGLGSHPRSTTGRRIRRRCCTHRPRRTPGLKSKGRSPRPHHLGRHLGVQGAGKAHRQGATTQTAGRASRSYDGRFGAARS